MARPSAARPSAPAALQLALAGAVSISSAASLARSGVEQAAGLGARRLQALRKPLLQDVDRLFKPPGRQVQGALAAA